MTPDNLINFGQIDRWQHKSCVATVGKGKKWATVYSIMSEEKGKGHGSELLLIMKKHYEAQGREFGSSVALSEAMRHLLKKLQIREYK